MSSMQKQSGELQVLYVAGRQVISFPQIVFTTKLTHADNWVNTLDTAENCLKCKKLLIQHIMTTCLALTF